MIYIDFETFSECDLESAGAWVYSKHPSTGVFCMAYAIDDGPVQIWKPGCDDKELKWLLTGLEIEAHNAFFEKSIYENIMIPRYEFSTLTDRQWHCSAAKCAARGLPRKLAMAAEALGLSEQKDMEGHKLMLKLSKTNPMKQLLERDEDLERLYEYCKQDVRTERALSKALGELSETERKVWLLDQEINHRGIRLDSASVRNALSIVREYSEHCLKDIPLITGGKITSVTQRDRTLAWLRSEGLNLSSLTKQSVMTALQDKSLSSPAQQVLEIRQQIGKTSTAKFSAMLDAKDEDDRIRDCFVYYGASTGRWAGRMVQPHNLTKPTIKDPEFCIKLLASRDWHMIDMFYDNVMGAIASCIRGMLVASPGNKLIAADYSAIEARVLFWHADEAEGLQMFRDGTDIYVNMAQTIYRQEVIGKDQRQLGKQTVLGAGFQMGPTRFWETCKSYGIAVDAKMAEVAIQSYREKFGRVKQFWYDIERAAIQAMQNPGKVRNFKHIAWAFNDKRDVLFCILPSGRRMAYNNPRLINEEGRTILTFMSVNSKTKKWDREKTYGGKLTENVVQATARDIMVHHMLTLPEDIVLHAHDEIVWDTNFYTEKQIQSVLSLPPKWAEGLPLKVETWEGERYRK